MGDQPITRTEFDGLAPMIKALLDQMAALTTKVDDITNNNNHNRNNPNRGGEPIPVIR
ncbi:hypothetical protein A2U01_0076717, partial [Trifolium medium]|nr:hypothetical protein [Trifolium medium]